jgi:hypothetical protein
LYGYVAVRDILNPMRNYIFNRPRDDPFVVGHDGFIHITGPKRGIIIGAHVLIEFDMKIKKGEVEDQLQFIDCVASFSPSRHATANRRRLDGGTKGVRWDALLPPTTFDARTWPPPPVSATTVRERRSGDDFF